MGNSATLAKLQGTWYARLKLEGFRDIEHASEDGSSSPFLTTGCRTDSRSRLQTQPHLVASTQVYHADAGEFLHEYSFTSARDRAVWTHHAGGKSLRQIAVAESISLRAAWTTVNRLQGAMKTWRATRVDEETPPMRGAGVDPARVITDAEWKAIEALLPRGRTGRRGRPARSHRPVVSALVWLARTGAPWRELPEPFGPWVTPYARYRAWVRAGLWPRIAEKIAHLLNTGLSRPVRRFEAFTL